MDTTSFVRNRYWILRHGKSIPNERGLIVSSMVRLFRFSYVYIYIFSFSCTKCLSFPQLLHGFAYYSARNSNNLCILKMVISRKFWGSHFVLYLNWYCSIGFFREICFQYLKFFHFLYKGKSFYIWDKSIGLVHSMYLELRPS